jgi:hypothetical protein
MAIRTATIATNVFIGTTPYGNVSQIQVSDRSQLNFPERAPTKMGILKLAYPASQRFNTAKSQLRFTTKAEFNSRAGILL